MLPRLKVRTYRVPIREVPLLVLIPAKQSSPWQAFHKRIPEIVSVEGIDRPKTALSGSGRHQAAPAPSLAAIAARLFPTVSDSDAIALSTLRSSSGSQEDDTSQRPAREPTAKSAPSEFGIEAEQVFELGGWKTTSDDVAVARVPARSPPLDSHQVTWLLT